MANPRYKTVHKPIYRNKDGWVLARCTTRGCGRLNYCEPHGVTAHCACSTDETVHVNIPYAMRDALGFTYVGPARLVYQESPK